MENANSTLEIVQYTIPGCQGNAVSFKIMPQFVKLLL